MCWLAAAWEPKYRLQVSHSYMTRADELMSVGVKGKEGRRGNGAEVNDNAALCFQWSVCGKVESDGSLPIPEQSIKNEAGPWSGQGCSCCGSWKASGWNELRGKRRFSRTWAILALTMTVVTHQHSFVRSSEIRQVFWWHPAYMQVAVSGPLPRNMRCESCLKSRHRP